MAAVRTGLDRLVADPAPLAGRRYGLVCHPASVTHDLVAAPAALAATGVGQLAALFGPQHGLSGHTQDNMIEWAGGYLDPRYGVPVHSLYGAFRKPTPHMLAGLDLMVIDLQDVGCRVYTFIWTMALILEACAEAGLPVLVLDRPNPLGGRRYEGPGLEPGYESFVGLYPLLLCHGLTIGEIARWLVGTQGLSADLTVIELEGWRGEPWAQTGLPWVLPSPNMPTLETALVYPGMVLFEGTRLSEGRGTCRPFEIVGAPGIDPDRWADELHESDLRGVRFRPLWFEPTFNKHAEQLCGGVQLHVTDPATFEPTVTAAVMLTTLRYLFGDLLQWLDPPYEYVHDRLPIDILAGSPDLRAGVEARRTAADWRAAWTPTRTRFRGLRAAWGVYERGG